MQSVRLNTHGEQWNEDIWQSLWKWRKQQCGSFTNKTTFLGASRVSINQITEKKEERKYKKEKTERFKKKDGYDKSDKKDKNPVGLDGNIWRCFRYDSTRHLASTCPQRANQYK